MARYKLADLLLFLLLHSVPWPRLAYKLGGTFASHWQILPA